MATPVGHSLAAYAVYKLYARPRGRNILRWVPLAAVVANVPDLDFVPGLLSGQPSLYHQGVTHSLTWAAGLSLVVAGLLYVRGESFRSVFGLCFFAYVSHLVLDLLGPDRRFPQGIPLFWPMSGAYFISPVAVLLGVRHASEHASTWQWFEGIFDLYNLAAVAVEIAWLAPLIVLSGRSE